MKTIKYLASAATAAFLALGSPFAASAANGHIFDIRPSDEFGTFVSGPVKTAEDPLGGGEKINFVVRMAKATKDATKWRLKHVGLNSEAVDAALNPFGIGIYVSGEIRIATLKSVRDTGDYFSDFVFEYVTKPGDFALPVVLANADGKPASDSAVANLSYYISPASKGVWTIVDENNSPANFWFGTPAYSPGVETINDYSLSGAGFYVKTIDFDANYEFPNAADPAQAIWRTVHQDSSIPGGATPSLELAGMPTNSVKLYVWSLHQVGVRMLNGVERDIHVEHNKTEKRIVSEIKVEAGKLKYPFEIYGLAQGQYDYLVLSAFPDFNYSDGTGAVHKDYIMVKVQCTEPLPPTIKVAPVNGAVTANSDYTHYVTELEVKLTQAYTEDVEVTITPSFENGAAADWGDYIRFSDVQDLTSLPEAVAPKVTIKAGKLVPESKLYVFALRSDTNTVGVTSHIRFTPATAHTGAQGAIQGWNVAQGDLTINAQNPVIVTPAEGDSTLTAVAGSERTLRITVADTYADMASDAGYEIYILKNSDIESSFVKLDGTYKAGQGGYLYKVGTTDQLPSVVYTVTDPAANKSTIYVKSPVSGNQSEERNFICTVSAPAGFTVAAIDGKTNNEYVEGDDVSVEIKLDRQNTTGGSLYAFLVPTSDKDKNAVDCSFLAENGGIGLEIPQYGTSVAGYFTLADGGTGAANSQFSYKVELRTAQVYQDGEKVSSFMCKNTLGLKSSNIIPKVDSVMMGLNETNEEGKFDGIVVAKGVKQTFTANVTEPGQFDLNATGEDAFQVRWLFKTTGFSVSGPEEAPTDGIVKGNPDENSASFTFNRAGTWTVTVELRDKDMSTFGNGELKGKYTFEVVVVDQPAITITGRTESGDEAVSFYETESADAGGSAYIDVNLAMNKCDFDLEVEVAIASGDATSATPGQFILQESANVKKKAGVDNVYVFTFPAGETKIPAIIKTLDGTMTSRTQGFVLTPAAVTTSIVPESGNKPANEYYVGTAKTLKVNNSAPTVDEADLYPAPGSTNMVAIGAADPITWNFTDVLPDFEGGITVTVKGGGGFSETVTTMAGAAGTFTPNFSSSGPQTVQLTIKDKDNGQVSFIWYYEVEVAKTLTIVAHGPASGLGMSSSRRYSAASGLGKGRVWADGRSNIKNFESFFNCGKSTSWAIYALGYKVGEVDESIDAGGNMRNDGTVPAYQYDGERDSYFYTWIQMMTSKEQGKEGTVTERTFGTPEYPGLTVSGTRVTLPTEQNDDGTFLDTTLEGVFSLEYLASDNMGDINQDGIPDVYVDRYNMNAGATGTVATAANDLVSLRGYNGPEDSPDDFLPAHDTSGLGALIPGLSDSWALFGSPFTAFLEVRGYGEGLNDAPARAGVQNVRPDRVYTDPTADPKSTLSYVEFLAWEEFAAANGLDAASADAWKLWSPERPTDPTKGDTDEDGFSDGYEYYFWYRAHVGYLDKSGNHRYLTGRAYDPRNPGEGRYISSAEIAALMDPITPSGDVSSANTRDTDNDGLPDLLEFLIGTNPFEFDTDGDGLADGWELMIAGTSPVLWQSYADSGDSLNDTLRNDDRDAMAFTTQSLEKNMLPVPDQIFLERQARYTFAVVDAEGDTDGMQWYTVKASDWTELTYVIDETAVGTLLTVGGQKYIATGDVKATASNRLALSLPRGSVFAVTNAADVAELVPDITVEYLRLAPVSLEAGTLLDEAPVPDTAYAVASLDSLPADGTCNAAWVYGNPGLAGYGMLALGRYQVPGKGAELCELPSIDREVALLHSLVYQEYGFDPRTAWSEKTPLASRWGTIKDGEIVENVYKGTQGGYAAHAARTRAYAMYDEFLVMSFFINNGVENSFMYRSEIPDSAPEWAKIWDGLTTNPQGPLSGVAVESEHYYGRNDPNGADTDGDGVPDGWELYTMAGPKDKDGKYVFAPPWAGFTTGVSSEPTTASHWSPFVGDAGRNMTDSVYVGSTDGLNQLREFGGTDSCAHYAEVSTTIVRHQSDVKWINKFFPTDPWNADTDGDGVNDNSEGSAFVYGSPVDNNKLWAIPGGGLNPCSVDTDLDGLPDPWENKYKGKTVYGGEDATYASGIEGEAKGNPLEGLIDGMDGTVQDAYSLPRGVTVTSGGSGLSCSGTVCRDYDRDGLENWQEYLTGTMRCWRYDDPLSPWTAIPKETYFDYIEEFGTWSFNAEKAAKKLGCVKADGTVDLDAFWYKTLVDKTSSIYNPYLVTDSSQGAQYFSRVVNAWDIAYLDDTLGGTGGAYYYFFDRINGEKIIDLWGEANGLMLGGTAPKSYVGCSPLKADSDQDGMDDYYELFHGMNPLLGESGAKASSNGPCDLVADGWTTGGGSNATDGSEEALLSAWNDSGSANIWTRKALLSGDYYRTGKAPKGNGYDFEYFPWLNGAATADPDGDDIRNQQEAIIPRVNITAKHTDPTPLWMTDSSYSQSLVRMYYRMPTRFDAVELQGDSFVNPDNTNEVFYFRDFHGYVPPNPEKMQPAKFSSFNPDAWQLAAAGKDNWMFSFEENEGFDTDHDGVSDFDESTSRFRDASDANDFDSPRRRQAMYFGGENDKSILQTLPIEKEAHPVSTKSYPENTDFCHFTVECWVKAESLKNSTVIERAIAVEKSNPGDNSYIRRNFNLSIKNGKWYAAFDPAGTISNSTVEAEGIAATTDWTHLAATYDGSALRLYVNGLQIRNTPSDLDPEYGASALCLHDVSVFWGARDYDLIATVVGAGFKRNSANDYSAALALTSEGAVAFKGLDAYENFFHGWIDEVRIWDGARTSDEVKETYKVRFTAEDAAANREAVYNEWKEGNRRYVAGNTARAELRYHYNFDAVFGAMTSAQTDLRRTPNGFTDGNVAKTELSRPEDWQISWFKPVLDAHGSAYRCNEVIGDVWVSWINNTVAHLPRFDGTILDSFYWSKDFEGWKLSNNSFPMTAEPYSKWTQMRYNRVLSHASGEFGAYAVPGARYSLIQSNPDAQGFVGGSNETWTVDYLSRFEFTGRNLNKQGDDMLALGGAFAKYVDTMWDDNGPSQPWEYTGVSSSLDGIPEWWQEYAHANYGVTGSASDIRWDSIVTRDGREMTAREAYWRDLAAGMMVVGGVATVNPDFEQLSDANGDGLPDWWEKIFSISKAQIADDIDNDGLADFAEYLVSEVFDFADLNPRLPRSDGYRLDYFGKIGSLYFGEILSDHDFMEDWWESLYGIKYLSSGIYDAHTDGDNDGWSNYAECRVGTSPDRISYLGVDESTMNDFPVPIVKLTCSYKGAQNAAAYPVVVKAYSKRNNSSMPDAVWSIASVGDTDAAEKSEVNDALRTKHFGMNSSASEMFNLGPGSVVVSSLRLKAKDLIWETGVYSVNEDGSKNILESKLGGSSNAEWYEICIDIPRSGDTVYGDIVIAKNHTIIGEINYQTGEANVDFSKLKDYFYTYQIQSSDAFGNLINRWQFGRIHLERSYVKIEWSSKQTTTGYPKTFYLADADVNSAEKPSQGHLYEGENWFEAFVDMDGDGHYSAGEPYGFKRGVDIGWSGTEFAIELTDTSPVFGRLRYNGGVWDCDRVVIHGSEAGVVVNSNVNSAVSGGVEDRLRIVCTSINGIKLAASAMTTVLDTKVQFPVRPYITEADILVGSGGLDVQDLGSLSSYQGQIVTDIGYSVVFGDGPLTANLSGNRAVPMEIVRRVDAWQIKPEIVTDGKPTVFHGAQPTFTWTMNGYNSYSSFKLQVRDTDGNVVYDSGSRLVPGLDADGNYTWTPDNLFVDDQCSNGSGVSVFANAKQYTWRVQMNNVKFGVSNSAWSNDSPEFRMNANVNYEANDTGYSCVNVCVKYFGPHKAIADALSADAKGKIRVEAFASPDFTGAPVARGFFEGDIASVTNDLYSTDGFHNVVLKGIPSGSWYLRAYIDTDGDFKRSNWESWGYANRRDEASSRNLYTPIPVTVGPAVAAVPIVNIYIEDTDIDGDWLPDAMEWTVSNGNLAAYGPGKFFDENAFGFDNDFQKRFTRVSASGNPLGSNLRALSSSSLMSASMTALLLGVDLTGHASGADALSAFVSPELVADGVSVESLKIENGKVIIKVVGETAPPAAAGVTSPVYDIKLPDTKTLAVTCNVYVKESLASDEWTLSVSERITVGGDAVEIQAGKAGAANGFYKVELVK